MGARCEDPTQHYDELIKTCVDSEEDDIGNPVGKSVKAGDGTDEQKETTSAEPVAEPSPFMPPPPPLVIASSTVPSPSCGNPHVMTVPKLIPQLPVLPRGTPHTRFSPAPAEFPVVAVVVTFSVATVFWMVVLGVLLCRRRLSAKTAQKRSGRDLADELEKVDLAAHVDAIGHQVGCRDITVPPAPFVAIQCSGSSDMGAIHAFPLPAMDLGSAMLVTTKSGQCAIDTTLQDGLR